MQDVSLKIKSFIFITHNNCLFCLRQCKLFWHLIFNLALKNRNVEKYFFNPHCFCITWRILKEKAHYFWNQFLSKSSDSRLQDIINWMSIDSEKAKCYLEMLLAKLSLLRKVEVKSVQ